MSCRLLVFFSLLASLATAWLSVHHAVARTTTTTALKAHHMLSSAFESVHSERLEEDCSTSYESLQWLDLDEFIGENNADTLSVPLYPLPAVYLPDRQVNYTLNNVQAQNIQMALDLQQGKAYFCTTLQAVDTGRLSRTGTLMRVVDMQIEKRRGEIRRIVVTCTAEAVVDIVKIDNADAFSKENRLRQSSEYLQCQVKIRSDSIDDEDNNINTCKQLMQQTCTDYNAVRKLYMEGIGKQDLPYFARDNVQSSLPAMDCTTATTMIAAADFWNIALHWQTLCATVRAGKQIDLDADRNELLIQAAMRKGGPLQLPVRLSDLTSQDRQNITRLETKAQEEWVDMGLDPCIDFAVLLSLTSYSDRLRLLSRLVKHERDRLTWKSLLGERVMNRTDTPPQRGAWFE